MFQYVDVSLHSCNRCLRCFSPSMLVYIAVIDIHDVSVRRCQSA